MRTKSITKDALLTGFKAKDIEGSNEVFHRIAQKTGFPVSLVVSQAYDPVECRENRPIKD